MSTILKRFSVYDLIIISVMAAAGIAIKPVASAVAHLISAPLGLPGGTVAGGLYMMWLVLAFAITGKHGAATLAALVQAGLVMLTGIGSHGFPWSIFTYTTPGLAVDVLMIILLVLCRRDFDKIASFFGGMIANFMGVFAVNVVLFRLPPIPLALALIVGALTGGIGGLIAWALYRVMKKFRLIRR